jgi:ABC-type branched-subunit amino acid transport system substrate-binding protein
MSGFAQFVGEFTERGLKAARGHIDDAGLLPGTTVEYEIVNAPVEDGAEGAVNAYNQLAADPEVMGVIWAITTGIREASTQIERDGMPVMITTADVVSTQSVDLGPGSTVWQFIPPNSWLVDALNRYAAEDRGYRTTALLWDSTVYYSTFAERFRESAESAGLEVVGIEEFTVATADFGAQLQRLKDAAPQCLSIHGLGENVAAITKGLAALDADYIDTPTAKDGPGWHPQIVGAAGGFTKQWAELVGPSANPHHVAAWYLGGSLQTPQITPINQWVLATSGQPPAGGEELPANALWALLQAAQQAGSTERDAVAEQLPGLAATFASLPFALDTDTHVALTEDDIVLTTLERSSGPAETDPPYVLGSEGQDPAAPGYTAAFVPAILVRPTLEANRRAQPEYISYVLENGIGTQCTKTPPDATGEDVELTPACRIH